MGIESIMQLKTFKAKLERYNMVIKMDEEKKELKEEKDSKEKDLEKNFDEQKKVLQALQRDISELKRCMGKIQNDLAELKNLSDLDQKIARIELGMERTYRVNFCYALGGSFITIGAITMSIGFTVSSVKSSSLLGGLLMIIAGILNLFIVPSLVKSKSSITNKLFSFAIVLFISGLIYWDWSIWSIIL